MSIQARIKSVSLIFACGTALFSDGYANSVIGSVNIVLTRIYGKNALARHNHTKVLSSVGFAGIIVGMLLFGYLSDKIGRKFGMMTATGIVAMFSGLSAASSGAHGSVGGLLSMLSAMRFFLGIGVGAEYPCGPVAAAEQSEEPGIKKNAQHRWFVLATSTMIDVGFIAASFVPLVLFWIFGNDHLRAVWRLSLGLGVIPALAVLLWRLNMDEPVRYKKDSMKYTRIPYLLILRRYWVSLAAVSFTWFIYNFILYPFGLYSSTLINNITGGSTDLATVFGWNVVINLFYLPGSIFGAYIVDYTGAKYSMLIGLLPQAPTGFIMSGLYVKLTDNIAAFAVVYGLFLSFGEIGPGNCVILLASKTSPTAIRGQYYGIAAACGKVGAFVGTWVFSPIVNAFGGAESARGNTGPFWIGSGLCLLSALVTVFFIEPLTQDGMDLEDRKFREYLEANGYDTSQMGLKGVTDTESIMEEKIEHKEQIV